MQSRKYNKKLENGEIIEKTAYEVSVSKLEMVKNCNEDKIINEIE